MNHSSFNIPSGNLSSLPHAVLNLETVKEHLALDLEHNSVPVQLAGRSRNTLIFEENVLYKKWDKKEIFSLKRKVNRHSRF